MAKLAVVWVLFCAFAASGVAALLRSSFTFGTFGVLAASFALAFYGIFHQKIDAFCQQGIGLAVKYLVWGGMAAFLALFIFVAVSGYSGGITGTENVIIVLGAGIKDEQVSDVLRQRLDTAFAEWKKNPEAVVVVSGGQGRGENIPEALAMQRYLAGRGIPESCILIEDKSSSTEENLVFSRSLLAEHGYSADAEIAVVTNAFHCYRAGQYAAKAGFSNITTVPAGINFLSVLPSYVREVFAVLDYWVFKR